MASKIQLTPAELLAQSQEMLALQKDYEDLFKNTGSILNQVNSNWSEVLANNFAGKLQSAQKAFTQITSMLGQGGALAATSANTFESMDSLLAKNVAGGLLQDVAGNTVNAIVNGVSNIGGGLGGLFQEEWENLKEGWKQTGDFLEWINGKYQDVPSPIRKKIEGILGSQLVAAGSVTYDIITGNVSWDTAETFLGEIMDDPYVQSIIGAFDYALDENTYLQQAAYEEQAGQYLVEGDILAGLGTLGGSFLDTIGLGAIDVGGGVAAAFIEGLPGVGLLQDTLGFDITDTWDKWMDSAHDGFSNMIESANAHVAEFEEGVQEVVGDIVDGAKDVVGDIVDGAKEAYNDIKDTYENVKDTVGDAIDGAKDKLGELASAAGDAAGKFLKNFKFR